MEQTVLDQKMNHLGALGLLANVSVHIAGPEQAEFRESIERCLDDAVDAGVIKSWRRILNRFEIDPAAGYFLKSAQSGVREKEGKK